MKYCTKCGAENLDGGIYCIACGERLIQEFESGTQQAPSALYQQSYPPISSTAGISVPVQPVREKYGHIIFHSSYNLLAIGALVFALSPLIELGITFLFSAVISSENETFSFLISLIDPICFGILIYGIYSISRSEPSSLNVQLRSVPIYLIIYIVVSFLIGILFGGLEVTSMESIEQVRNMVGQGIIFIFIQLGISIFLVISALKFTSWFEEFVTMLGAPYNAPTTRFKWFSFITLGNWGLVAVSFLLLLSAIENLSVATISTVELLLVIVSISFFAILILQFLSGYKIYSVLNNIRQGKYDGTYQAQIKKRYQF